MKGSLRKVIGNKLVLNAPPPPPFLSLYCFDEIYAKQFIMSDQKFLAVFDIFFWFISFISNKLATQPPLNTGFKIQLKSFLNLFQCKRQFQKY